MPNLLWQKKQKSFFVSELLTGQETFNGNAHK